MTDPGQRVIYEFGEFRVDPLARRLSNDDGNLALTSKAFETLLVLISKRGAVVTKNELMDAVWSETAVEENNLTQQIAALRRVFGEKARDHRFIVTLPGKGYSFVAPVTEITLGAGQELVLTETRRSSLTIDISDSGWTGLMNYFSRPAVRGYSLAAVYAIVICVLGFWPLIFGSTFRTEPQTIAVLSFRTTAAEDEALGAGIRDTLRARLGNLEDVAVRSIGPAVSGDDAVLAGRQLDADVVFTGSIQREQDRVRVAVEIVDVEGERLLWGQTFDCNRSELFELQDAIAVEAVRVLKTARL